MKREQILTMIGEAPDAYVADAKKGIQRRRIARRTRWLGGIAAVLAVVLLFNGLPGIPLMVAAKTVSGASAGAPSDP